MEWISSFSLHLFISTYLNVNVPVFLNNSLKTFIEQILILYGRPVHVALHPDPGLTVHAPLGRKQMCLYIIDKVLWGKSIKKDIFPFFPPFFCWRRGTGTSSGKESRKKSFVTSLVFPKKWMTTKLGRRGRGVRALVVAPLVEEFFCGFHNEG